MKLIRRFDYRARRMALARLFGTDDVEGEITRLYTIEMLCAQEIVDRIQSAGIKITPRTIQRIVKQNNGIRPVGDAFRLAGKKGRVHWAFKDKRFKVARRTMNKAMRYNIFKRDGYRCSICGNTPDNCILEIDHIIALAHGGKDTPENMRVLCHDCNDGKRIAERER